MNQPNILKNYMLRLNVYLVKFLISLNQFIIAYILNEKNFNFKEIPHSLLTGI